MSVFLIFFVAIIEEEANVEFTEGVKIGKYYLKVNIFYNNYNYV